MTSYHHHEEDEKDEENLATNSPICFNCLRVKTILLSMTDMRSTFFISNDDDDDNDDMKHSY